MRRLADLDALNFGWLCAVLDRRARISYEHALAGKTGLCTATSTFLRVAVADSRNLSRIVGQIDAQISVMHFDADMAARTMMLISRGISGEPDRRTEVHSSKEKRLLATDAPLSAVVLLDGVDNHKGRLG